MAYRHGRTSNVVTMVKNSQCMQFSQRISPIKSLTNLRFNRWVVWVVQVGGVGHLGFGVLGSKIIMAVWSL